MVPERVAECLRKKRAGHTSNVRQTVPLMCRHATVLRSIVVVFFCSDSRVPRKCSVRGTGSCGQS